MVGTTPPMKATRARTLETRTKGQVPETVTAVAQVAKTRGSKLARAARKELTLNRKNSLSETRRLKAVKTRNSRGDLRGQINPGKYVAEWGHTPL